MKRKHFLGMLLREIRTAAAEAPAIYFAPLVGALRGIRAEYARLENLSKDRSRRTD